MSSSEPKNSEMRLADVRPHPDVRLGDAYQRADLSGVIHPQLDDRDLRPLSQLDQRQRQTDVVVEVPLLRITRYARRQKLRRHFLRRGLPRAACDRHDLRAPTPAALAAPAPAAPTIVSSTSMTTRIDCRPGTVEALARPRPRFDHDASRRRPQRLRRQNPLRRTARLESRRTARRRRRSRIDRNAGELASASPETIAAASPPPPTALLGDPMSGPTV